MNKSTLAKYIKHCRKKLGLNHSQFAELLGKKRSTITKYESKDLAIQIVPPATIFADIQIAVGDFKEPNYTNNDVF